MENNQDTKINDLHSLLKQIDLNNVIWVSDVEVLALKQKLTALGTDLKKCMGKCDISDQNLPKEYTDILLQPIRTVLTRIRVGQKGDDTKAMGWMFTIPFKYYEVFFKNEQILDVVSVFKDGFTSVSEESTIASIKKFFRVATFLMSQLSEMVDVSKSIIRAVNGTDRKLIEEGIVALAQIKKLVNMKLYTIKLDIDVQLMGEFLNMVAQFVNIIWSMTGAKLLQKTYDHPIDRLHSTDMIRSFASKTKPDAYWDDKLNELSLFIRKNIPHWKLSPDDYASYFIRRQQSDADKSVFFDGSNALQIHNTTPFRRYAFSDYFTMQHTIKRGRDGSNVEAFIEDHATQALHNASSDYRLNGKRSLEDDVSPEDCYVPYQGQKSSDYFRIKALRKVGNKTNSSSLDEICEENDILQKRIEKPVLNTEAVYEDDSKASLHDASSKHTLKQHNRKRDRDASFESSKDHPLLFKGPLDCDRSKHRKISIKEDLSTLEESFDDGELLPVSSKMEGNHKSEPLDHLRQLHSVKHGYSDIKFNSILKDIGEEMALIINDFFKDIGNQSEYSRFVVSLDQCIIKLPYNRPWKEYFSETQNENRDIANEIELMYDKVMQLLLKIKEHESSNLMPDVLHIQNAGISNCYVKFSVPGDYILEVDKKQNALSYNHFLDGEFKKTDKLRDELIAYLNKTSEKLKNVKLNESRYCTKDNYDDYFVWVTSWKDLKHEVESCVGQLKQLYRDIEGFLNSVAENFDTHEFRQLISQQNKEISDNYRKILSSLQELSGWEQRINTNHKKTLINENEEKYRNMIKNHEAININEDGKSMLTQDYENQLITSEFYFGVIENVHNAIIKLLTSICDQLIYMHFNKGTVQKIPDLEEIYELKLSQQIRDPKFNSYNEVLLYFYDCLHIEKEDVFNKYKALYNRKEYVVISAFVESNVTLKKTWSQFGKMIDKWYKDWQNEMQVSKVKQMLDEWSMHSREMLDKIYSGEEWEEDVNNWDQKMDTVDTISRKQEILQEFKTIYESHCAYRAQFNNYSLEFVRVLKDIKVNNTADVIKQVDENISSIEKANKLRLKQIMATYKSNEAVIIKRLKTFEAVVASAIQQHEKDLQDGRNLLIESIHGFPISSPKYSQFLKLIADDSFFQTSETDEDTYKKKVVIRYLDILNSLLCKSFDEKNDKAFISDVQNHTNVCNIITVIFKELKDSVEYFQNLFSKRMHEEISIFYDEKLNIEYRIKQIQSVVQYLGTDIDQCFQNLNVLLENAFQKYEQMKKKCDEVDARMQILTNDVNIYTSKYSNTLHSIDSFLKINVGDQSHSFFSVSCDQFINELNDLMIYSKKIISYCQAIKDMGDLSDVILKRICSTQDKVQQEIQEIEKYKLNVHKKDEEFVSFLTQQHETEIKNRFKTLSQTFIRLMKDDTRTITDWNEEVTILNDMDVMMGEKVTFDEESMDTDDFYIWKKFFDEEVHNTLVALMSSCRIKKHSQTLIEYIIAHIEKYSKSVEKDFDKFIKSDIIELKDSIKKNLDMSKIAYGNTNRMLSLITESKMNHLHNFSICNEFYMGILSLVIVDVEHFVNDFLSPLISNLQPNNTKYMSTQAVYLQSKTESILSSYNLYLDNKNFNIWVDNTKQETEEIFARDQKSMSSQLTVVTQDLNNWLSEIVDTQYSEDLNVLRLREQCLNKSIESEIQALTQTHQQFVQTINAYITDDFFIKINEKNKTKKVILDVLEQYKTRMNGIYVEYCDHIKNYWGSLKNDALKKINQLQELKFGAIINNKLTSVETYLKQSNINTDVVQLQWEQCKQMIQKYFGKEDIWNTEVIDGSFRQCLIEFKDNVVTTHFYKTPQDKIENAKFLLVISSRQENLKDVVKVLEESVSLAEKDINDILEIIDTFCKAMNFSDFKNMYSLEYHFRMVNQAKHDLKKICYSYANMKSNYVAKKFSEMIIKYLAVKFEIFRSISDMMNGLYTKLKEVSFDICEDTLNILENKGRLLYDLIDLKFKEVEKKLYKFNINLKAEHTKLYDNLLSETDAFSKSCMDRILEDNLSPENNLAKVNAEFKNLCEEFSSKKTKLMYIVKKIKGNYHKWKQCAIKIKENPVISESALLKFNKSLSQFTDNIDSRLKNLLRDNIIDKSYSEKWEIVMVYAITDPHYIRIYDILDTCVITNERLFVREPNAYESLDICAKFTCIYEILMPLWISKENNNILGTFANTRNHFHGMELMKDICNDNVIFYKVIFSLLSENKPPEVEKLYPSLFVLELMLICKLCTNQNSNTIFSLNTTNPFSNKTAINLLKVSPNNSCESFIDICKIGMQAFWYRVLQFGKNIGGFSTTERVQFSIASLRIIIQSWLAYKKVVNFNAKAFSDKDINTLKTFHPWGTEFIAHNESENHNSPLIDLEDSLKFKVVKTSPQYDDCKTLIPWGTLYCMVKESMGLTHNYLLRYSPVVYLFNTSNDDFFSNGRILCSYVAYCIYSNIFISETKKHELWSMYGEYGKTLSEHMMDTYKVSWFTNITKSKHFKPSSTSYNEIITEFDNITDYCTVSEKEYTRVKHNFQSSEMSSHAKTGFCLFDILMFSIVTGVDLVAAYRQGSFWTELINTTYRPDINLYSKCIPEQPFANLFDSSNEMFKFLITFDRIFFPILTSTTEEPVYQKSSDEIRTSEKLKPLPFLLIECDFNVVGFAYSISESDVPFKVSLDIKTVCDGLIHNQIIHKLHHPLKRNIEQKLLLSNEESELGKKKWDSNFTGTLLYANPELDVANDTVLGYEETVGLGIGDLTVLDNTESDLRVADSTSLEKEESELDLNDLTLSTDLLIEPDLYTEFDGDNALMTELGAYDSHSYPYRSVVIDENTSPIHQYNVNESGNINMYQNHSIASINMDSSNFYKSDCSENGTASDGPITESMLLKKLNEVEEDVTNEMIINGQLRMKEKVHQDNYDDSHQYDYDESLRDIMETLMQIKITLEPE